MNKPNRNDEGDREQRLAEIADAIQDQVVGSPNSISDEIVTDDLPVDELVEIQELQQAMEFVEQARKSLGELETDFQHLAPSEPERHSTIAAANDATLANASVDPDSAQATFETVGRFQILSTLGQGGFARVFLAVDPHLNRHVALKVPLPHAIADPAARRRFEREGRAAAILSHPRIVPIYETGMVGLISYIAFGYCPGPTLANWATDRSNQISARTAAEIIESISDAVAHAHQRGIVHRDLKPTNILLEQVGDVPIAEQQVASCVRVSDFGLAQLSSSSDETLTIAGAVVGTPGYMSPEQARGASQIVPASDVFSIGVMLYQLLTGHRPFARDTQLATLRAIEHDDPQRPTEIRSDIPRDLEAICLKCLRKLPEQRYATAFELNEDLQRWRRGEPIAARPATTLERFNKWRHRNPRLAFATAAAIVFLAAGLAGTTWQWRVAKRNLSASLAAQAKAEESSKAAKAAAGKEREARLRAEKIAEFLGTTYRSPDPSIDGRNVRVVDLLARAEREIADSFREQPADRWTLLRQIGNAYASLGLSEQAAMLLNDVHAQQEEYRATVEKPGEAEQRESILLLDSLAQVTSNLSDFARAEQLTRTAYDRAVKCFGATHPQTLQLMASHGSLLQNVNDHKNAEVKLREALAGFEKADFQDQLIVARTRGALGGLLTRLGKLDEAIPLLEQSLSQLDGEWRNDRSRLSALSAYATALGSDRVNRLEDALPIRKEVFEIAEQVYGEHHPQTALMLNNFAATHNRLGNSQQAADLYDDCLERTRIAYGKESPFAHLCAYSAATANRDAGNFEKASELFQAALSGLQQTLGPGHPRTIKCLRTVAKFAMSQSNWPDAESYFEELIEILTKQLGSDSFEVAIVESQLALAQVADGNLKPGLAAINKFFEWVDSLPSEKSKERQLGLRMHARLLQKLTKEDQWTEARPFIDRYRDAVGNDRDTPDYLLSRLFSARQAIHEGKPSLASQIAKQCLPIAADLTALGPNDLLLVTNSLTAIAESTDDEKLSERLKETAIQVQAIAD